MAKRRLRQGATKGGSETFAQNCRYRPIMHFLARFSTTISRSIIPMIMLAATAWACSVPVFRYALEHWQADPFRAVVFYRGALTPEQQAQIQTLRGDEEKAPKTNVAITAVDVNSDMSPDWTALWQEQRNARLPWLALQFPRSSSKSATIAAAPLHEAAALNLFDSPARQQIVERLGEGQSAVWVLVESSDAARDDAAAKVLEDRLEYLMGVLELPELDQMDVVNGLISVGQEELRLEFSLLRVSRNDPAEHAFASMLFGTEPDLAALDEPIVFPIFGRGRALYALAGKGIRAETIDRAATFLIGKCSCQVKDQNPGTDLLFTADWKSMAKASPLLERQLPDLSHLAKAAEPVAVVTKPNAAEAKLPVGSQLWLPAALVIAAVFGGMALLRRGK
jgi:hypothetical protein